MHEHQGEHVEEEEQHDERPPQGDGAIPEARHQRREGAEDLQQPEGAQDPRELQQAHDPHEGDVRVLVVHAQLPEHCVRQGDDHHDEVEDVPVHVGVQEEVGAVHGHAQDQLGGEEAEDGPLYPRERLGSLLAQVLHLPVRRPGHERRAEQDDGGAGARERVREDQPGQPAHPPRLLQLLPPLRGVHHPLHGVPEMHVMDLIGAQMELGSLGLNEDSKQGLVRPRSGRHHGAALGQ
mmetsp:Transcript_89780/g.249366  ORF Transcript_89780/g.249366 Transcript_89780/m.249366 type:complete len:236 (+) Transcript_89780:395-1102(+)